MPGVNYSERRGVNYPERCDRELVIGFWLRLRCLAGDILRAEWKLFNNNQCLRLTVPRPMRSADLQGHRFHMTMARVLLLHTNALVGYKYSNGIDNTDPSDDVWIHCHWVKEQGIHTTHRVSPKRVAAPISRLIQVVDDLKQLRRAEITLADAVA